MGATEARAWDQHRSFSAIIWKHLPQDLRVRAQAKYPNGCPSSEDQRKAYLDLASKLELQTGEVPGVLKLDFSFCPTSVEGFFSSTVFDEPDHGIDQDLSEGADPYHHRKWMGGPVGPTSQGFRHMYFLGFEWLHPIRSFQIPLSPIGEALQRVAALSGEARQLLRSSNSNDVFWGFRLLGWASHYVQDLSQPFHSTQLPSLEMVPWKSVLKGDLVGETTRTISNYHWAYEGYVRDALFRDQLTFDTCFDGRVSESAAGITTPSVEPLEIAREAARSSRTLAPSLGRALMSSFGAALKDPAIQLAHRVGQAPALTSEQTAPQAPINTVTCDALRNTFTHTERLIRSVL